MRSISQPDPERHLLAAGEVGCAIHAGQIRAQLLEWTLPHRERIHIAAVDPHQQAIPQPRCGEVCIHCSLDQVLEFFVCEVDCHAMLPLDYLLRACVWR